MKRLKALWVEWKARRAGRKRMHGSKIARATRDVTGPTGWVFSNAWDQLEQHGDAYMKSFDRRLPASTFVSERDRTRFGQPMPIIERCLEDRSAAAVAARALSVEEDANQSLPVFTIPLEFDEETQEALSSSPSNEDLRPG